MAKMLKIIQTLEDGRVPAKEATRSKIGGHKKRISRTEYQRLVNKFEMEGFMAQKGLWNLAKEKILRARGELPKEEGDAVREYKAMHEENFLSCWLREHVIGKEERTAKYSENNEGGRGEKRKREEEKEETETETVQGRCDGCVSVEAFEIFSQEGDLGVVVTCHGWIFWSSARTCLIVRLALVRMCVWCLM